LNIKNSKLQITNNKQYPNSNLQYSKPVSICHELPTHPLRGALFENHVVSETAKVYLHHRRPAPLFFWRDRTGHEIDLVIDDAGRLFPVEIKSAQTLSGGMLDSLLWWSKLSGQPPTPPP